MDKYSKETIQMALDKFQPEYAKRGETLTEHDVSVLLDNLTGYIETLAEWDKKEQK